MRDDAQMMLIGTILLLVLFLGFSALSEPKAPADPQGSRLIDETTSVRTHVHAFIDDLCDGTDIAGSNDQVAQSMRFLARGEAAHGYILAWGIVNCTATGVGTIADVILSDGRSSVEEDMSA